MLYLTHPPLLNPVLSIALKVMVKEIWNNPCNNDDTLVNDFGIVIKGSALKTCAGTTWLNDEVGNVIFLIRTSFLLMCACMYISYQFYFVMLVFHYFFTTGQGLIGLFPT